MLKLVALFLFLVPSFTTYFADRIQGTAAPGISLWQLLYFFIVLLVVRILAGLPVLFFAISTVSFLALPVVFVGSLIWVVKTLATGDIGQIYAQSKHYVSLLLNMLAVIPLAIAFISQIPFREYELHLFQRTGGVSLREKSLLMATRVINHILFTVIPNVLQVWREEHRTKQPLLLHEVPEDIFVERAKRLKQRIIKSVMQMFDVGLASICFALEYIPLWALEIGALPSPQQIEEHRDGK
jgi:hypothetical protein